MILKRHGLLSLIFLLSFALTALADQYQKIDSAVARVRGPVGTGTGTVFWRDASNAYILTNNHVAGRRGTAVDIQFWDNGETLSYIKGRVVRSVRTQGYTDVAVIQVSNSSLESAGADPDFIPILIDGEEEYVFEGATVLSKGCGSGAWPTGFTGRIKEVGRTLDFYPRPAGGRSGSALFSYDGKYIVGLIAWSTGGSQHSYDGRDESDGYGMAMGVDVIWNVLRGGQYTDDEKPRDPSHVPVIDDYGKIVSSALEKWLVDYEFEFTTYRQAYENSFEDGKTFLVLLDLENCVYCDMLKREIKSLFEAQQIDINVAVVSRDGDESKIWNRLSDKSSGYPQLIMFYQNDQGEWSVKRFVGYKDKEFLENWIIRE